MNLDIINLTGQTLYVLPTNLVGGIRKVSEEDFNDFISKCIVIQGNRTNVASCSIRRDFKKILVSGGSEIYLSTPEITENKSMAIPPPKENTIYIVSSIVYAAFAHKRPDIYIVDEPIRNYKGGVVACSSFGRPKYRDLESSIEECISYVDRLAKKIGPSLKEDEAWLFAKLSSSIYSLKNM